MTVQLSSPPSSVDDRFVVVSDPGPGTIVELGPGSQLSVTFRHGLGPSRWHVVDQPGHVVVLADTGHEFQFLVFGHPDCSTPLRFERRRPDHDIAHDVCELLVVATDPAHDRVSAAGARTSRSA